MHFQEAPTTGVHTFRFEATFLQQHTECLLCSFTPLRYSEGLLEMKVTMKNKVINGKDWYLFLITNKKNHAYSSQKEK